jgi:hypothetical protein
MKAMTTDMYILIRKLYCDPEVRKLYGFWIFTSNKLYVISADTDSGERRFFVFCGTGKFSPAMGQPLKRAIWTELHNG